MRFGVCCDLSEANFIASLGFDYIEGNASIIAAMDESAFEAIKKTVLSSPIRAEAFCVLIPREIRLTGPDVNVDKIAAYLDGLFPRLKALGAETVVFGSGGARRIPDGFDRAEGYHQLVVAGRLLAEKGEKYGITVALEPLYKKGSNIINTQREGLGLVRDVDRPRFRILSDYFHLFAAGESTDEVAACGSLLAHTHIVNPVAHRCPYEGDGINYDEFFAGLARAGYNGRISYEGPISDASSELPEALRLLRSLEKKYIL
jgi:D-psicose/D-tagatose/L-ribulose 3-epimerase